MKRCSQCGEDKPLGDFYSRRGATDGRGGQCKVCRLTYNRTHYRQTPAMRDRRRSRHYRTAYGMTLAEVASLLEAQGGRCALCGRPEEESYHGLHMDHDHVTGKVRSLLCADCNTGIGKLQDDPDLLRRAADYIEAHRALPAFLPEDGGPLTTHST